MKKLVVGSMAGVSIALAGLSMAAPAQAQQNIGWFWNSGDRDVQGKFTAEGEIFSAREVDGDSYLRWTVSGYSTVTWKVPGNQENVQKNNNQSYAEGKIVTLRACEQWDGGLPDDCSGDKQGVS